MHIGVICTSYPRHDGDPAGNFVLGLNRYLPGRRADLVYSDGSLRPEGAPGRVSPMGIDVAAFRAPGPREEARGRLGLRGPTALFLGRLVPVKGVALLLDALGLTPGLDLLVAG